jgi:hypothetical protein
MFPDSSLWDGITGFRVSTELSMFPDSSLWDGITGFRVSTDLFLKRRNGYVRCPQHSLTITNLWGQKKGNENPEEASKKVCC